MKKQFKKIIAKMGALVGIIAVGTMPVLMLAACSNNDTFQDPRHTDWRLSRTLDNRLFESVGLRYNFPTVYAPYMFDEEWSYSWEIYSMTDENGLAGNFAQIAQDAESGFMLFPVANADRATINFRAVIEIEGYMYIRNPSIIVGGYIRVPNPTFEYLHFTVNSFDQSQDVFTMLFSPNQSGSDFYESRGIGRRRVFGLYDINRRVTLDELGTEIGAVSHANRESAEIYTLASDEMQLGWRYSGTPDLAFSIEIPSSNALGDAVKSANITRTYLYCNKDVPLYHPTATGERLRRLYSIEDDVLRVTPVLSYMGDGTYRLTSLDVDFLSSGERTVVVEGLNSERDADDNLMARYEFTYNIIDGVNASDFNDVKNLEFNARTYYIINGVTMEDGTVLTPHISETQWASQGAGAFLAGTELSETNPLNSALFETVAIRLHNRNSYTFKEFFRFAPAFRYRDIVIRNNMDTWSEGTWFFGNVYGNGFTIDASPYMDNSNAYRNVMGTSHFGTGQEGVFAHRGFAWGEVYAFTMASNHTVLDNIHLIGHNVVHESGMAARLNDFNRVGVVGPSSFPGTAATFQFESNTNTIVGGDNAWNRPQGGDRFHGNRNEIVGMNSSTVATGQKAVHHNGNLATGRFPKNLVIQNAIIEKGIILVGAHNFADVENPLVVRNSVLRYAGLTAIFGRSFTRHDVFRNPTAHNAGGEWIRNDNNIAGFNQLPMVTLDDGTSRRFGNHIEMEDVIVFEISTGVVTTDDQFAGTHVTVRGDNQLFTWKRLDDVVLPAFMMPDQDWHSTLPVPGINAIAQNLIENFLRENQEVALMQGGVTWLSLLKIDLGAGPNNISGAGDTRVAIIDTGIDGAPLINFFMRTPTDGGVTLAQQQQIFANRGMSAIIAAMTPAPFPIP